MRKRASKFTRGRLIRDAVRIASESLENNSNGEYNLPSILVRYTQGPKSALGLHREFYIPTSPLPKYYPADSEIARHIFDFQASEAISAVVGGGFPIREKRFDPLVCRDCDG